MTCTCNSCRNLKFLNSDMITNISIVYLSLIWPILRCVRIVNDSARPSTAATTLYKSSSSFCLKTGRGRRGTTPKPEGL